MFLLIVLYVVFFKTDYRRAKEEEGSEMVEKGEVNCNEYKMGKAEEESEKLFVNLEQPEIWGKCSSIKILP